MNWKECTFFSVCVICASVLLFRAAGCVEVAMETDAEVAKVYYEQGHPAPPRQHQP